MNQPNLFSEDRYQPPVRRSDPPTSHRAAEYIWQKLPLLQSEMYRAFALLGKATANEAANLCVSNNAGNHESYRKRAKELERKGLVRIAYARRCNVTGQPAAVYEVMKCRTN